MFKVPQNALARLALSGTALMLVFSIQFRNFNHPTRGSFVILSLSCASTRHNKCRANG